MHARPGSRRRSRFAEFVGRSVHSRSPQRAHQDAVHLADNLIPRLVNGETPVSSSSERTIPPSSGKRLHDHRIATPYPASLSGYDTSSAIGDSRSGAMPRREELALEAEAAGPVESTLRLARSS
jgi:hypothetical protein